MVTLFFLTFKTLALALNCTDLADLTTTIHIFSDTSFWVVGPNYPNGAYATAMNGLYTPNKYTKGIAIWETYKPVSNQYNQILTFTKDFYIPGILVSATIHYNVDDKAYFYLNNDFTNCYTDTWFDYESRSCDVSSYVSQGSNTLKVEVINKGGQALISFRLEIVMKVKGYN